MVDSPMAGDDALVGSSFGGSAPPLRGLLAPSDIRISAPIACIHSAALFEQWKNGTYQERPLFPNSHLA